MKVIFWTNFIYDLYKERGLIGGIAVQMSFWAQTFLDNGWSVYSISNKESTRLNGINFFKIPYIPVLNIVIEFIYSFFYVIIIRPDVIVLRGANRYLAFLSLWAKLFSVRLIFFGASDVNFQYEKEGINRKHDRILYRFGLRNTDYFVAQNKVQYDLLINEYNKKNIITIPNIWLKQDQDNQQRDVILWVANFRQLKRPQLFIQLARDFPQYQFVMIGGWLDKDLFDDCKREADKLQNLEFMGAQSFMNVNKEFARAKYFICTSEIEGFPNTFLQSWSNSIPIITTFDPSSLVLNKRLGLVVKSYEELKDAVLLIESDKKLYADLQKNINDYFELSHNAVTQYDMLKSFLK